MLHFAKIHLKYSPRNKEKSLDKKYLLQFAPKYSLDDANQNIPFNAFQFA